jgi:hypothetical protein
MEEKGIEFHCKGSVKKLSRAFSKAEGIESQTESKFTKRRRSSHSLCLMVDLAN